MKILILETTGLHGGMGNYNIGVCYGLAKQGCEVILISDNFSTTISNEDVLELIDGRAIRIFGLFEGVYDKSAHLLTRFILFIKAIVNSFIKAKKENVDIVYTHIFNFSLHELLYLLAMGCVGVPVYVCIHDAESLGKQYSSTAKEIIIKLLSLNKFRVVTHSSQTEDILMGLFDNRKNVKKIGHCDSDIINSKNPSNSELNRDIGLSDGSEYILFFGVIKKEKGLGILLQAWDKIYRDYPNKKLLVVGRVRDKLSQIEARLLDDLVNKDKLVFINRFVDDKDVPRYFRSSLLVVLPYEKVFSSGVLLRTLGYEKPVLLSDIDAFKDVAGSYPDFYFKSGDFTDLALKMKNFLDSSFIQDKSCAEVMKVNESLSWEKLGEDMQCFFLHGSIINLRPL